MKRLILLAVVCTFYMTAAAQQNVGIGTNTPNTKLDIKGALALREGTALTLANGGSSGGTNDNIALPYILGTTDAASFYRITGPTGPFSVYGIIPATGADGEVVTLINTTGKVMTVVNSGSFTTTNSIITQSGANLVDNAGTGGNSSITLQYSKNAAGTGVAGWFVTGTENFTTPVSSLPNLAGDVTGAVNGNTVVNINGSPLGTTSGAAAGALLQWNGSNWAAASVTAGTTGFWTLNGNNLYPASTAYNVGIGTTSPPSPFSAVYGSAGTNSYSGSAGNWYDPTNFAGYIQNNNNAPGRYGLLVSDYWRSSENFVFAVDGRYYNNGAVSGDSHNAYLVVRGDGNVGIGTAGPNSALDVNGVINSASGFRYSNTNQPAGTYLRSTGTNFVPSAIQASDLSAGISGTANYVAKFTGANVIGNSQVYDDGANVGIGTAAPVVKLDINGPVAVNRNYIYLASGGDVNHAITNISSIDGEQFRFYNSLDLFQTNGTGNTSRLFINTSGNVGIGTTSPGYQLDVAGAVNLQGASGGVIGSGSRLIFATGGPTSTLIEENWGLNLIGTATQPVKVYNTSLLVGYTGSGTNYGSGNLYVSGNVGIGTTSPAVTLDVQGAICSNRNWYYLASGGDQNHAIGNIAGDGEQFRYWQFLDFYSPLGGGESRFLSNGYLGIGTTAPNSPLEVNGSVRVDGNPIYLNGSTDNNHYIQIRNSGSPNANGPRIAGYYGCDWYSTAYGRVLAELIDQSQYSGTYLGNMETPYGYLATANTYSTNAGTWMDVANDLDGIDAIKPMVARGSSAGKNILINDPKSLPFNLATESNYDSGTYFVSLADLSSLALGGVRELRHETKTRDEAQDARIDRLEKLVSQLTGKELGEMEFTASATAYKGMENYVIMDARISPKSNIIIDGLSNYEIISQTEGSFELKFKTPPADDVKFTYSSKF